MEWLSRRIFTVVHLVQFGGLRGLPISLSCLPQRNERRYNWIRLARQHLKFNQNLIYL
jgi:hypothetical protein